MSFSPIGIESHFCLEKANPIVYGLENPAEAATL